MTKTVFGVNIGLFGREGAESPSIPGFFGNFYASETTLWVCCVARKATRPDVVYGSVHMHAQQPTAVSERTGMKLDVSHVPETGLGVNVELDAGEVDISDATADLTGDLQLNGRVLEVGEEMLLEGTLRGTLSLSCGRCLNSFLQPFEIAVSARYVNAAENEHEDQADAGPRDVTRVPFVGDQIDLSSGIREDLLLNIPLKPLCRKNCRGLCPQCGADLNEGECTCEKKTADPRLAELRDIRAALEGEHKEQDEL